MLTAFVRAFQTPDLRKKMLITLGLIALFRFGASLPTPGALSLRSATREDADCGRPAASGGQHSNKTDFSVAGKIRALPD